jgi:hypothetical protein
VDKTPTLESILNEIEDQGSLSDEEASPLLTTAEVYDYGIPRLSCSKTYFLPQSVTYTQDGGETQSLASRGSSDARSRSSSDRRNRKPGVARGTGSILRHVILKGISSQLNSATVIATSITFICNYILMYLSTW